MYQKEDDYEQILFDFSEKVTVSKNGTCEFGMKFLPLSKDGLLPQFPVRVTLARDSAMEDIIVSSEQFRIIAYKVLVEQVSVPELSYPSFDISLVDAAGHRISLNAKLEVALFSTCSAVNTAAPLVEWVRETHIFSWSFKSGMRNIDHANLPTAIQFKTVPAYRGKTAFRVRVTVLSVGASQGGGSCVSLTKIGRGWTSFCSLNGTGASAGATAAAAAVAAAAVAAATAAGSSADAGAQRGAPPLLPPPPSAGMPPPLYTGASNLPIPGALGGQHSPYSQVSPLLLTQPLQDNHVTMPILASDASLVLSLNALERSMGMEEKDVIKSPQDIFRQFSQAVMKALNGAFTVTDDTSALSKDALNEAYNM
jgi:hypothetical protein